MYIMILLRIVHYDPCTCDIDTFYTSIPALLSLYCPVFYNNISLIGHSSCMNHCYLLSNGSANVQCLVLKLYICLEHRRDKVHETMDNNNN